MGGPKVFDDDYHSLSLSLSCALGNLSNETEERGGWATAKSRQTNHPQTSPTLIYTLQSDVSNESPKSSSSSSNSDIQSEKHFPPKPMSSFSGRYIINTFRLST